MQRLFRFQQWLLWCGLILGLVLMVGCGPIEPPPRVEGPVKVVATLAPLADWARRVGGERVVVTQLVPAGRNPRSHQLSPTDKAALESAEVIVLNGAGLEPWLEPALLPKITRRALVIDLAEFVGPEAEVVVVERSQSPLIGELNNEQLGRQQAGQSILVRPAVLSPYLWLDPGTAKAAVELLAHTLIRADPAGLRGYRQRLAAYRAELDNLDAELQRQLDRIPQRAFNDQAGFLAPFRSHFKLAPVPTRLIARANVPTFTDRWAAVAPVHSSAYQLDPLNHEQYIPLMRTFTEQFITALKP